jgi:hypothetical protein
MQGVGAGRRACRHVAEGGRHVAGTEDAEWQRLHLPRAQALLKQRAQLLQLRGRHAAPTKTPFSLSWPQQGPRQAMPRGRLQPAGAAQF